jgi:phage FluMu protein Com
MVETWEVKMSKIEKKIDFLLERIYEIERCIEDELSYEVDVVFCDNCGFSCPIDRAPSKQYRRDGTTYLCPKCKDWPQELQKVGEETRHTFKAKRYEDEEWEKMYYVFPILELGNDYFKCPRCANICHESMRENVSIASHYESENEHIEFFEGSITCECGQTFKTMKIEIEEKR